MYHFENVPFEMQDLDNWIVWKKEWSENREKFTKIPYDAKTGFKAKSNDPSTWTDFETAVAVSESFDGLGFMFNGSGMYGVDLDNVESEIMRYIDGDTEENIVADFIDILSSYTETSPSGKGIHIICYGQLPPGGRRKGDIEMYDSGRFFTVTGNRIGSHSKLADDSEIGKINYLHNKYIGQETVSVENLSAYESYGNDLSVVEIIEAIRKSKHGMRFGLFMEGGWEQFYPSQSEADMAFCNDLAFWTACDPEKMDEIYRKSSMLRDKWDSKREGSTYGQITMNKAIVSASSMYQPVGDFDLKINDLTGGKPKLQQKHFSYDDTGNAQRLLRAFGDNILYSYIHKKYFFYSGKTWVEDNMGKIYEMADYIANNIGKEPLFVADETDKELVEAAKKNLVKHAKYTRSYRGKENMLKDTQHHVAIGTDEFDKDGYLFNTQSGYIDLNNGMLMEHNKSKRMSRISFSEYNMKAEAPIWNNFLKETFQNNQDLISYVQRAVGYSMSADMSEQVMFILLGEGNNGKSVFLNVLEDAFGTYSMNMQPSTIASKVGSQSADSDIARLKGARLVTTTEPNKGMKLDEGRVKQLTGGDTVTARFLYGSEFEFKPEFKIWMATNHKPVISGTDDGIWRRMAVIPFEYKVPKSKIDKKLTAKLKGELSGILRWCVEGYQSWREIGLEEPQIVKDQRDTYRDEMDMVHAFISDKCVKSSDASVRKSELWSTFQDWVKENNEYSKMSSRKFYKEIDKHYQVSKTKSGLRYVGIGLQFDDLRKTQITSVLDNISELG